MRKTSHDGGDNTSITSGVENDVKKPIVGIIKTKRNSIKKKVQNFSHESDDAVIEPLLQKDKPGVTNQSAKHLLPKVKTDSMSDDKDKLLSDSRIEKPSLSTAPSASLTSGTKDNNITKSFASTATTLHNHMNTNVFGSFEGVKSNIVSPKSQILVEIDGSKQSSYNPSPLIFTTAKIHADGKTKQMEPVQVTPVPILSTIEGSFIKPENTSSNNLSGPLGKYNNVLNSVCIKSTSPSTIISQVPNEFSKTTSDFPSSSGFSSKFLSEKKDDKVLNKISTSNMSMNDTMKPIISVDVNITLPAKKTRSELNTTEISLVAPYNAKLNTVSSENSGNKIDVNKNIETPCSAGHGLSENGKHDPDTFGKDNHAMHDISGNKQLKRQKNSTVEENDRSIGSRMDSTFMSGNKHASNDIVDKSKSNGKLQHAFDYGKCLPKLNTDITTSSCLGSSTTDIKPIANIVSSIAKTAPSPSITPVVTPITNNSAPVTATTMLSTNKPTSTTISLTFKTSVPDIMTTSKSTAIKTSFKPIVTMESSTLPNKSETAASNISTATKFRITDANIISTVEPSLTTTTIPTAKPAVIASTTATLAVTVTTIPPTVKPIITATTSSIDKIAVTSVIITPSTKPVSTTSIVTSTNKSKEITSMVTSKPSVITTTIIPIAKPIVTATTTTKTSFTTETSKPRVTAITSSMDKIAVTSATNVTPKTKSTGTITAVTTSTSSISSTITTSATKPAVSTAIMTTTPKPAVTAVDTTSVVKPVVTTTYTSKAAIVTTVMMPISKPAVTTTSKTTLNKLSSVPDTASKDIASTAKSNVSTKSTPSTVSSTRELSNTVVLTNSGSSKTLKSVDPVAISEKTKLNTKTTIASDVSRPQTISMTTSKAATASSTVPVTSTVKAQDNHTQSAVLKSTTIPVSKPKNTSSKHSTSVISSISPEVTSSSMKQSLAKPSTAKLSGSTGNSVKTLITSNEKSGGSSIAGTIAKTSLSNKQTDSNNSDSKKS